MQPIHVFDGTGLSIARIAELSRRSGPVDLSPQAWERIAAARAIVERQLASGAAIYGTNTGIGSQKDAAVGDQLLAEFSNRMIVSEATDFPGPPAADPVVRACLVVLINNIAGGRTGVRPELARRLLELYGAARMPTVRDDTSYGIADLTPLSQLSLAVLGSSLDERAPVLGTRFDLAPKESVSLIDNNSFALGSGALVLVEIERLLAAFDLAAATALEGFRGGLRAHTECAAGRSATGPGPLPAQPPPGARGQPPASAGSGALFAGSLELSQHHADSRRGLRGMGVGEDSIRRRDQRLRG